MTWLDRDERRLLAGYYVNIRDIGVDRWYPIEELTRLLRWGSYGRTLSEYGDEQPPRNHPQDFSSLKTAIKQHIQLTRRVELANKRLNQRGLIKATPHQTEEVVGITLSLEGFDLGRRYCSWVQRTGLRFNEYKNHWIWLIVAFLGGGIASKLIDYVYRMLTTHNP